MSERLAIGGRAHREVRRRSGTAGSREPRRVYATPRGAGVRADPRGSTAERSSNRRTRKIRLPPAVPRKRPADPIGPPLWCAESGGLLPARASQLKPQSRLRKSRGHPVRPQGRYRTNVDQKRKSSHRGTTKRWRADRIRPAGGRSCCSTLPGAQSRRGRVRWCQRRRATCIRTREVGCTARKRPSPRGSR